VATIAALPLATGQLALESPQTINGLRCSRNSHGGSNPVEQTENYASTSADIIIIVIIEDLES
jgi:hypothetical protein